MREKLIELIETTVPREKVAAYGEVPVTVVQIADHLIANGVTVQNWIPVTERLPECGECVIVYDTREDYIGMWEFSGVAWYNDDYNPLDIDEVTHWMPLPHPPKGE